MSILDSIYSLRRDYNSGKFDVSNAADTPFKQFEAWFDVVMKSDFIEPTAMVLSTATLNGKPSSRVVLLKKADENGFIFYSNYDSRKGNEIKNNPAGSLLFYWDKLERQVRIEGIIEKISKEESEKYFNTRPYESRLGAWASRQSEKLVSRFSLIREVAKLMLKYPVDVPLPDFWGGYRLIPEYYEFWQGRESRLHDRIAYQKNGSDWNKFRLYP